MSVGAGASPLAHGAARTGSGAGVRAGALAGLPLPPDTFLLDFDGVIVDSVAFKTQAFLDVYEGESPEHLATIVAHQLAHGGVTRREKFRHFERHVFGRPADDATLDRLANDYHDRVFGAVLGCPFLPGAMDFLEATYRQIDLHLISGTPHDELVEIVVQRGLARYFRTVRGAPPSKRHAFAAVLSEGYAPGRSLAVGDAPTEQKAAEGLGIPFLGIVADGLPDPFPAHVLRVATLEPVTALLEAR